MVSRGQHRSVDTHCVAAPAHHPLFDRTMNAPFLPIRPSCGQVLLSSQSCAADTQRRIARQHFLNRSHSAPAYTHRVAASVHLLSQDQRSAAHPHLDGVLTHSIAGGDIADSPIPIGDPSLPHSFFRPSYFDIAHTHRDSARSNFLLTNHPQLVKTQTCPVRQQPSAYGAIVVTPQPKVIRSMRNFYDRTIVRCTHTQSSPVRSTFLAKRQRTPVCTHGFCTLGNFCTRANDTALTPQCRSLGCMPLIRGHRSSVTHSSNAPDQSSMVPDHYRLADIQTGSVRHHT